MANGITSRAEEVREAFNVDSRQLHSPVLRNFSLDIDPGEVVLIAGASGCGKSTVLRFLSEDIHELEKWMDIRGTATGLDPELTARLTHAWDDSMPLVDQIGGSAKEAIGILNSVGLAEAHLYVKRPSQISDGQRYRFAVALLCDSKKPVWVADEFASALDPLTAALVAKGIRKRAYDAGATLVVAAPHFQSFIDSLIPNKLVTMRWGGLADVISLKCGFRVLGGSVHLKITNTCRRELTGVQLLGVRRNGEPHMIQDIGSIGPKNSVEASQLPINLVESLGSLVVATEQKVGDVVYFDSRAL